MPPAPRTSMLNSTAPLDKSRFDADGRTSCHGRACRGEVFDAIRLRPPQAFSIGPTGILRRREPEARAVRWAPAGDRRDLKETRPPQPADHFLVTTAETGQKCRATLRRISAGPDLVVVVPSTVAIAAPRAQATLTA